MPDENINKLKIDSEIKISNHIVDSLLQRNNFNIQDFMDIVASAAGGGNYKQKGGNYNQSSGGSHSQGDGGDYTQTKRIINPDGVLTNLDLERFRNIRLEDLESIRDSINNTIKKHKR